MRCAWFGQRADRTLAPTALGRRARKRGSRVDGRKSPTIPISATGCMQGGSMPQLASRDDPSGKKRLHVPRPCGFCGYVSGFVAADLAAEAPQGV